MIISKVVARFFSRRLPVHLMLDPEIDPFQMQPFVDLRLILPEQISFSADLNDSLKAKVEISYFAQEHWGMQIHFLSHETLILQELDKILIFCIISLQNIYKYS